MNPTTGHRLIARSGRAGGGRAAQLAAAAGRAFTLIEVLIAVGAVALIGVAIAAVFDQTGRTVTAGRRLSALTAYGALIEQQMRVDFSRMTREGFLLIHNQHADTNGQQGFQYNFGPGALNTPGTGGQDAVALHPDELPERWRARRIDEIVFFVEGDFTTARDDRLHRGGVARGNAARIYYGHGMRRTPDQLPTSLYNLPVLDDAMAAPGAAGGPLGAALGAPLPAGNPNRYASDWTLLRHQTVLCMPQSTTTPPPYPSWFHPPYADSDIQIANQPASSNIFRVLEVLFPAAGSTPPPQGTPVVRPGPVFASSGIVDVATTSLPEIRLIVETADSAPVGGLTQPDVDFFAPIDGTTTPNNANPDGSNPGLDGKWRPHPADPDIITRQQAWMEEALPAWSHAAGPDYASRTRMRYEPQPPNYLGVLESATTVPILEYLRADQLMLTSSIFVPHCTEFIVEWSFGKYYPSDPAHPDYVAGREGEVIWHGMERLASGLPPEPYPNRDSVAYPYDDTDPLAQIERRFRRINGSVIHDHQGPLQPATGLPAPNDPQRYVQSWLIHNFNATFPFQRGEPVMSYFGYSDPTFDPDKDTGLGSLGQLNWPTDAATPTIPWPWPRLVRVTLGLADASDPSIEQRFQFVFELPADPEP